MGRVQRSAAVVIREPGERNRVLAVRRPPGDADLPGIWGLPAATLRPHEAWESAVRRAGIEKLAVRLDDIREITRGTGAPAGRIIEMRLYEAQVAAGYPVVPQPYPDVTQYAEWRWADERELRGAAATGSLCCRLFLETLPADPDPEEDG